MMKKENLRSGNAQHRVLPHHHRKKRCCGGLSSASLFYLIVGCSFFLALLNLLVDQKELVGLPSNTPSSSTSIISTTKKNEYIPPNTPDQASSSSSVAQSVAAATTTTTSKLPTQHACDGYDGIYLISQGDIGGAAGTIFFQFVIGQIIYAEKYNLKPWVYFNNISYIIYDPIIHGQGPGVTLKTRGGMMNASHIVRKNGHWRDRVPGPPVQLPPAEQQTELQLEGTGVWEHYFEPISDFIPGDTSCESKPLVQMELFLITPGIHGFAEWAPRCWRYHYAPDYMTQPHIPIHEWLEPQRLLANSIVNKYIRFKPDILQAAQAANPECSLHSNPCLGLHIRASDKAAGRRQIQTHEFLPYAVAFIKAGGQSIYLATDSTKVLEEVKTTWPASIQSRIRTIGDNVIRSTDDKAVFDIGNSTHDRTNREVLIEIQALANCQFMIHGFSAVTESSIWINVDLHDTSVNLEDPEHLLPMVFGTLVQMILRGEPRDHWPSRRKMHQWWKEETTIAELGARASEHHQSCRGYQGVLLISKVGPGDTAGVAFFNSIINQLLYAEMHNLKPWIHLGEDSPLIYDKDVHSQGSGMTMELLDGYGVTTVQDAQDASGVYPGEPALRAQSANVKSFQFTGNGIWNSYFYPVSQDLRPGDDSCRQIPLISMDATLVSPGLSHWCPYCVRPYRYDGVPDHLWNPANSNLKEWYEPMRKKAHDIVKKYYHFRPHIQRRANEINPTTDPSNNTVPCLAVHFRNAFKKGSHRQLVKANEFQDYIHSFLRAGGKSIFIATDSHRVLENMKASSEAFPENLQNIIKSQGPHVVRSSGGKINKWLVHEIAEHHRVNSEVLADILAMSKCHLFLHGHSTTSEAVFYLNPDLHRNSLNMEDPNRLTPQAFEQLSRQVIGQYQATSPAVLPPPSQSDNLQSRRLMNTTVLTREPARQCKRNSIIYLAQKEHSTYGRDSYAILKESLRLMYKNYLSLADHKDNTDLFIFHTGDFDGKDLLDIEAQFGPEYYGITRLVDLSGSTYWQRPLWHLNDNPNKNWYAYPLFSEGYRHMMRWYAIGLWDFFDSYNQATGCSYRYLFRLDEDSYIHSPIRYDIFDFMNNNNYAYGYRMCAYEMKVTQRIQKVFRRAKGASWTPVRDVDLQMCGFYNNFFVADIQHFRSPPVQDFLRIVDRQGLIYRRRLGDLMIHSLSVYFFAAPERVHRFLDFTYQHSTENQTSGCVVWGGIEAGYEDPDAQKTLDEYYQSKIVQLNCPNNATFLSEDDLSPTYAHFPSHLKGRLFLHSIMAGNVEKPGTGILSG